MIYGEDSAGFNGKYHSYGEGKEKGDDLKRKTNVFLSYPSSSPFHGRKKKDQQ